MSKELSIHFIGRTTLLLLRFGDCFQLVITFGLNPHNNFTLLFLYCGGSIGSKNRFSINHGRMDSKK